MSSKASLFHHPIHPMTIVFPLAFLFGSVVVDLVTSVGSFDKSTATLLRTFSWFMLGLGNLGALLAAVPGLIDYFYIRDDKQVRGTATLHMMLNLVNLGIFSSAFALRWKTPDHCHTRLSAVLTAIGACLLGTSAWLGHSLVYRYGVGVEAAKKSQ